MMSFVTVGTENGIAVFETQESTSSPLVASTALLLPPE